MRNPSQTAGGLNAAMSRSRFAEYLQTRLAASNADMGLPWSEGVDAETYFDDLGTDAAVMWYEQGARTSYLMAAFVRDRMRKGDDQQTATLAAWAALVRPTKICVVCGDGNVVPSPFVFPVEAPLSVWGVPVATKAEALVLIAQGDAAVLAALLAAQP